MNNFKLIILYFQQKIQLPTMEFNDLHSHPFSQQLKFIYLVTKKNLLLIKNTLSMVYSIIFKY